MMRRRRGIALFDGMGRNGRDASASGDRRENAKAKAFLSAPIN
jgi:hypothetical protein